MDDLYEKPRPEEVPWHMEAPHGALQELVDRQIVKPCKVLEVGCGLGTSSIYLAQQGFRVSGIDSSEIAIQYAKQQALQKNVEVDFFQADFLKLKQSFQGDFDFIFDWSVLHHIYPAQRMLYLQTIKRLLSPNALYLSVSFSENDPAFGGEGKYRETPIGTTLYFSSEQEISELFEKYVELLDVKTIEVAGKPYTHLAVYALTKNSPKN